MSRETLKILLDRLSEGGFPVIFDNGTYTFSVTLEGVTDMLLTGHLDADGGSSTNDAYIDFFENQDINVGMSNDLNVRAGNDANVGGENATNLALSGADLGFFGHAAAPQQTATTLPQVIAALQAYGLLT